jgi:hypothetical protein
VVAEKAAGRADSAVSRRSYMRELEIVRCDVALEAEGFRRSALVRCESGVVWREIRPHVPTSELTERPVSAASPARIGDVRIEHEGRLRDLHAVTVAGGREDRSRRSGWGVGRIRLCVNERAAR